MLVNMSPLRYAILGLLARRPRSGYQLAKVMEEPIGFFWNARHSQIHPLLGELESDGLIDHTDHQGRGPHPTKTYAITEQGRAALVSWAGTPPAHNPPRDELMLKVYSLWLVDRTSARRLIRQHRDEHRDMLAEYERHEQELLGDHATDLRRFRRGSDTSGTALPGATGCWAPSTPHRTSHRGVPPR